MAPAPARFFLLAVTLPLHTLAAVTETFSEIIVAHASPTFCPTTGRFMDWQPDKDYIACCNNWFGTATLTTALGPGSTPVYACCSSGATCTGPMKVMSDWSYDAAGEATLIPLENAPSPTGAFGVTAAPGASTGTVSGPGATPYTTSGGVVVYVNNDNNLENSNDINIGNGAKPLSDGAIGGISAAAALLSALAAWFGIWYARKRRGKRGSIHTPNIPPNAIESWQQPHSPQSPKEVRWQSGPGTTGWGQQPQELAVKHY